MQHHLNNNPLISFFILFSSLNISRFNKFYSVHVLSIVFVRPPTVSKPFKLSIFAKTMTTNSLQPKKISIAFEHYILV